MSHIETTIKLVIFSVIENRLKIYLKDNKLPEDPIESVISLDEEAGGIFSAKTNLKKDNLFSEQLYTLCDNNQLIIVYYLLIPSPEVEGRERKYFAYSQGKNLNDSDSNIIKYAVQRLRWKIEYTNVVYSLLPQEFTFANLQNVYEAILGITLDKRNFRKKILSLNIIEPTGHILNRGRARPAEMFRFRKKKLTFVKIL